MDRQLPRISRETRLLLGIVLVSLASLWVLARLRFPDQPRNPNPVPPVLAQFAAASPFEAMAAAVSDLDTKVGPTLTRVNFTPRGADPAARAIVRLGVPLDGERVVLIVPPGESALVSSPPLTRVDPGSGLATASVRTVNRAALVPWEPARAPAPRFLIAAEASREGVSFRPVFIGAFTPVMASRWPSPVWRLPAATAIGDGALLFTDDGLFAGALVVRGGERTLVPPDTLTVVGGALATSEAKPRGVIGIAVQELTPQVSAAVGVERGMVVTWVDPAGPAAGLLQPLDVIDGIWGQPLTAAEQWEAELDRLQVGNRLDVSVRRAGREPLPVSITAAAPAHADRPAPLGLTLRLRRNVGAEIVRVEPGSAADHAGLLPGDIITVLDAQQAPTPAQVTRAYASAEEDRPLALALTRGSTHLVVALEKRW
jgi:hypothetical protein